MATKDEALDLEEDWADVRPASPKTHFEWKLEVDRDLYAGLLTDADKRTEVSAEGYARQPVVEGDPLRFPAATGEWGVIEAIGVFDAPIGGNLLRYIEVDAYRPSPGVVELADRLGVEPEVLSRPEAPQLFEMNGESNHAVVLPADGPRTVSVWFRTHLDGLHPMVSVTDRYSLQLVDGHVVYQEGGLRVVTRAPFHDGQWHHVAVAYSETMEVYVDGRWCHTVTVRDAPALVTGEPTPATLDEIAIWDRELSDEEIAAVYNAGTPTDLANQGSLSQGLTAWFRMGDGEEPLLNRPVEGFSRLSEASELLEAPQAPAEPEEPQEPARSRYEALMDEDGES